MLLFIVIPVHVVGDLCPGDVVVDPAESDQPTQLLVLLLRPAPVVGHDIVFSHVPRLTDSAVENPWINSNSSAN